MTKTDIAIYRGLKEKFDPEVHVGFFITSDTGELLLGDQSLGQTISGWEINDGVLKLKLNTGRDILVTFPEATETVKGLLSAADKAQLNALQENLDSKVDKVTGKSLLADSEIEKLAGLPNSTELTNSIATAKAAGDNAQSDLNAHKQNKSNPHEVTKDQVGLGNVTNDAQVKRSEMGVANGVATLDADGKVPASQLPSYVDDIIDVYATYSKSDTGVLSNVTLYLDAAHTQLVTGEAGKIYQNIADGEPQYQFRWTGTIFSQTGASSLILGEVTGTAYDGAKGKANADNIAKIKGTSLSHIKDAAPVTTAADKVSLNYECFEGEQYGTAGTDHTADIPAATTSKAGVMSAADKTKLENLNSKLVVADEEDVTAVDGKIKFKDRDATNGMGYKILRLPENGILTQDMINEANTIYEIRYNFDLNGATITIPENCTLKFEGGKVANGKLVLLNTSIVNYSNSLIFEVVLEGSLCSSLYPSWFGAKGDGVTDDTNFLRTAVHMSSNLKCKLKFPSGRVYKVSGPLNYIDGAYINLTVNFEGNAPAKLKVYTPGKWGGISMTKNTHLFEGADISGDINSMIICGIRDESVHMFDNCKCKAFSLRNSTVSNVGAVFFDSSLVSSSHIENNIFLTAFYFSRNQSTSSNCVDSNIYGNYINGGEELNNNSCFEFSNYNGSLIYDNFIDYYRTIYAVKAMSPLYGGSINSLNNQYLVFKYLWTKKNIVNLSINSVGDCFNWTDSTKLAKLSSYIPELYTGRDGNNYDLPSHIIRIEAITSLSFVNSVFELNIGNILYILGNAYEYNNSINIESPLVESGSMVPILPQGSNSPIYNGGNYKHKLINLPDTTIETVESLPILSIGWCLRMVGQKVLYKNTIYVSTFIFDPSSSTYEAVWVPRCTNGWKIIR